ncbi:uncharacterized protein LOC127869536 [Dreissena polymorpha]|uniref:uncharacterized protein LOC127869536 n=1 Tax=Dreissena polymorpha TaxID=45954 RepID=UPI002264CF46|nr:uncharacterized protein LOC127869536 [Dreissena polymorpha]
MEGSEEIEGVVPSCWIMDKNVRWPLVSDAKKYILECRQPSLKWRSFPLVKRKLESRSFLECEESEETTTQERSESEKEEEDGRGRRKKQVTLKFLDFVMDPDEVSNGHGPQSPRKKGGANRDSLSRSSSENSRSRSPLEPRSVSEESCSSTSRSKNDASSTPIRRPPNNTKTPKSLGQSNQHNSNYPMPEARFQKRVISMLSEIKSMLQEGARSQPITPGLDALESWSGGPCETAEEFVELENVLKSVEKRQQLIRLLSSVGGKTLRENVKRMMQKVMNVSLMSKFNLSGQTRPNLEPKIGVKHTAVYTVIKASVSQSIGHTEKDLEDVISKILKYAPDRKGGVGRRLEKTSP